MLVINLLTVLTHHLVGETIHDHFLNLSLLSFHPPQ